jgi:2-polyprenyl-3-methyl-5-hydroxy-6-metoxy-1,4-benzoquinol methylase
MNRSLLPLLACPDCEGEAPLELAVERLDGDDIITGGLTCAACRRQYPIVDGIPRFVAAAENYSENFAFEWQRWGRVQIDRFAGHRLSTQRFIADSRWPPEWVQGKTVLDAGCGAGRFTDVAATLGARVIAIDLSGAVSAARRNTEANRASVDVVQASLLRLPFRKNIFDGIFCMGVIQHTPDPRGIMANLPALLKPSGKLCYNFYETDWRTRFQPLKYALRSITPHLPHAVNHALALFLTTLFFPLSWLLSHVRYVRFVNIMLPICASHDPALTLRQQFLWTLLDTFDWYTPRYEIRQSHTRVAALLRQTGLSDVQSAPGLAWALKSPGAAG